MRAIGLLSVLSLVAVAGGGCATVDVKGREVLRLGPLRDVSVVAESVDPAPVAIDAGTDALTDEELDAIARSLPAVLDDELERMTQGGVARVGRAKIDGCKLRAGAGKTATLYVAKCRVKLMVDDVAVLAVQTEAVRRLPATTITAKEAEQLKTLVRNPLLSAEDSRVVMVAAIEAAAVLMRDGRLPPVDDDDPAAQELPRDARLRKAALARDRIARPGNPQAALFDLRSSGVPADAERAVPFLSSEDPAVRAAAVDALGELCAPATARHLEPLAASDTESELVRASAVRALERLRACGTLGSGADR